MRFLKSGRSVLGILTRAPGASFPRVFEYVYRPVCRQRCYVSRRDTACASVARSSFFNFGMNTGTSDTAKNFGVFWIITLPLSLAVLTSSSMWPFMKSKIWKQKQVVDWSYNHIVRKVPAILSRIQDILQNLSRGGVHDVNGWRCTNGYMW